MDELEIVQFHQIQGLNVFVNTVTYRSPHFHNEWELLWVLDAPLKAIWQQKEYILQPGDLVFFGSGSYANHVGMYVGDGMMIHSPQTGDVIKYASIVSGYYNNCYYAARRIVQ